MARMRIVKPGFFANDALAELPALTRLLFIGLWCVADRAGRLEDRPKRIKAEVLPYDDGDVDTMLQALHESGFILRYSCDEHRYIQVVNFAKHQSPHIKEVASTIPAPGLHGASTVQDTHPSALVTDTGTDTERDTASDASASSRPSSQNGHDTQAKRTPAKQTPPVAPRPPKPSKPRDDQWRATWDVLAQSFGEPEGPDESAIRAKHTDYFRGMNAQPEEIARRIANHAAMRESGAIPDYGLTIEKLRRSWSEFREVTKPSPRKMASAPAGAQLAGIPDA